MKELKEQEKSNTLHRGLSVVPKTDDEVQFQLAQVNAITFTCFLHCAKKGRVVKNMKSEVAIGKIAIEKIPMLKWQSMQG